jgi:RNA recognition motif-containing protein
MHSTSAKVLREHLESFVPEHCLGSIRILRDKKTKKSKGFGFIEVYSEEIVKMLTESSTKHVSQLLAEFQASSKPSIFLLSGRKLDFQLAKKESKDKPGSRKKSIEFRRLFVGGLNLATDDGSLFEYFSQFGTVSSAYVIRHYKTGISKRFGYVVFENRSDVDKAMYIDNNTNLTQGYSNSAKFPILNSQKTREKRKHLLDGTEISIELYKPKDRQNTANLSRVDRDLQMQTSITDSDFKRPRQSTKNTWDSRKVHSGSNIDPQKGYNIRKFSSEQSFMPHRTPNQNNNPNRGHKHGTPIFSNSHG